MKVTGTKKFQVVLTYNLEEESATRAVEKVMVQSIYDPIAFSVEPLYAEDDDDD